MKYKKGDLVWTLFWGIIQRVEIYPTDRDGFYSIKDGGGRNYTAPESVLFPTKQAAIDYFKGGE